MFLFGGASVVLAILAAYRECIASSAIPYRIAGLGWFDASPLFCRRGSCSSDRMDSSSSKC
ncbi:MAG TPA: hypothetical protein VN445_05920 [Rectinemataceae bacterium]|nr:hypothetical protein [Rectinemataceae bacterium]